jgi:hypothetical protein
MIISTELLQSITASETAATCLPVRMRHQTSMFDDDTKCFMSSEAITKERQQDQQLGCLHLWQQQCRISGIEKHTEGVPRSEFEKTNDRSACHLVIPDFM